jgi:hypothetical protein
MNLFNQYHFTHITRKFLSSSCKEVKVKVMGKVVPVRVVRFIPRPLYPQGKSPQYPLDRRLGGPQSQSG